MNWSIKKFLAETYDFAGKPEQKPGDQVRGTEKAKKTGYEPGTPYKKHPFQGRLVGGSSESVKHDDLGGQYLDEFERFMNSAQGEEIDEDSDHPSHECPWCGGSGDDEDYRPCAHCAGTGEIMHDPNDPNDIFRDRYNDFDPGDEEIDEAPITPTTTAAQPAQSNAPQSPQEKAAAAKALVTAKSALTSTTGIDPMKLAKGDQPSMKKAAQVVGNIASDPKFGQQLKTLITTQQRQQPK